MTLALWDRSGGSLAADCGSQVQWDVGWLVFGYRPGSLWGKSLEVYKAGRWDHFFPFLSFKVGNGERVRFWSDVWCGDRPLKVVYPWLFLIAGDRDALVADLMSFRNGVLHWELTFSQNVQDWEMDSMNSFMDLICSANVVGNGVDTLCWQRKSKGGFTVKSFYQSLRPSPPWMFPWKGVWKPKVPPRVAFFLWATVLGKILTAENLRKRHIIIVSCCCLCKSAGESIGHLFIIVQWQKNYGMQCSVSLGFCG